ncbi:MAG TPA: hypothetical protein PKE69_09140 [Pyrinomonadaceae bacterium]|nr:hypothetical protein [Pyrinomonadaceae bacterium]
MERGHLARPFAQSVERQTLHRNQVDLMCDGSRPFSQSLEGAGEKDARAPIKNYGL